METCESWGRGSDEMLGPFCAPKTTLESGPSSIEDDDEDGKKQKQRNNKKALRRLPGFNDNWNGNDDDYNDVDDDNVEGGDDSGSAKSAR